MNAPIVIFAFNRSEPLRRLIDSLKECKEAIDSDLFVFVDGARSIAEAEKVKQVQELVKSVGGFKTVNYQFSSVNEGLGISIINGVREVLSKYGTVIVLEDDLIVQPNFLQFMNDALNRYENNEKVFSICGYTNKVTIPNDYPYDVYFCPRSSSWGWGTWRNRWETVDWNLEPWENYRKYKKTFNNWGGSDCFGMLENWKKGRNKSWAIRFCFAQFLQGKLSLFPTKSFIVNDGFDGKGTNCKKWSRFKYELIDGNKRTLNYPTTVSENPQLTKQAIAYNSIMIRIWSKIMYFIYR